MDLDRTKQDLADTNYVICMGLLISNTISGEFFNSFKFSVFNTHFPSREFNVIFVKERTSKPLKLLQQGERFFESGKLPFRIAFKYGLEKDFLPLLAERGYKESRPEVVMTLSDLPDKNIFRKDLDIRRVSNTGELAHFQEVVEKSYSLPAGSGPAVITERVLNLPDAEMFVGYADNQPACTSMLIKTGPVAGIYWVAALDQFRNRGFGKAITVEALVAGKKRGCTFANLQASVLGEPVYRKIGFDNPYNYQSYHSPD
ncbi:MAG: GNAT family N-acetyltransferase [Deltaproteobacteria bacterium]|nr:GNAT family N-acetyltransferase [Deltaproteobacteria bacterium]